MLSAKTQPVTTVDVACVWPHWPTYGLIDDLLPTIECWFGDGRRVAIATLVNIVGSSPRPLGSEMAISDTGDVAGYVSGGCVEDAVAAEALAAMADGQPRLLDYGAGSPVLDVQLTCGGRIGISVRVLGDVGAYAARLRQARERRQPIAVHIDLNSGAHYDASPGDAPDESDATFVKIFLPSPRLMLIGSDPVTLALCQLAPLFGYQVGLIRPYGPEKPPPGAVLMHYDPRPLARALVDMPLDAWTAVYTLTHNFDDDLAVLLQALRSPAFCVGVLGSRRKAAERFGRLAEAGLEQAAEARLRTPAGLAIGAREPREIALAIIGELVAHRPR